MRSAIQHFQNAAHDLALAIDRLIGIGVGADRDHARLVILRRQFLLQKLRRIGLCKQLRFEVEPRRQAQKSVGRPRETIDTAMFAAPVRIDRTIKTDTGGIVAWERAPRPDRRSLARAPASAEKGEVAPAGSEGAVTGGCLRA